jgi:hypothetical protein
MVGDLGTCRRSTRLALPFCDSIYARPSPEPSALRSLEPISTPLPSSSAIPSSSSSTAWSILRSQPKSRAKAGPAKRSAALMDQSQDHETVFRSVSAPGPSVVSQHTSIPRESAFSKNNKRRRTTLGSSPSATHPQTHPLSQTQAYSASQTIPKSHSWTSPIHRRVITRSPFFEKRYYWRNYDLFTQLDDAHDDPAKRLGNHCLIFDYEKINLDVGTLGEGGEREAEKIKDVF